MMFAFCSCASCTGSANLKKKPSKPSDLVHFLPRTQYIACTKIYNNFDIKMVHAMDHSTLVCPTNPQKMHHQQVIIMVYNEYE